MSIVSASDLKSPVRSVARPAKPAPALPGEYVHEDAIGLLTLQLLEGRSDDVIQTVDRLLGSLGATEDREDISDLRILRGLAELDLLSATTGVCAPASETALRFALRILPVLKRLVATGAPPPAASIPSDKSAMAASGQPLSRREKEILVLTGLGMSNKEIAAQLWISEGTVKKHQSNMFMKLHARNRTEAVMKARQIGIF